MRFRRTNESLKYKNNYLEKKIISGISPEILFTYFYDKRTEERTFDDNIFLFSKNHNRMISKNFLWNMMNNEEQFTNSIKF